MIEYTVQWAEEEYRERMAVSLISFPALVTAELALVMTAVRLLVMYYPTLKASWGRYTKERPLVLVLVCGYAAIEIALWSAAGSVGLSRLVADISSHFVSLFAWT